MRAILVAGLALLLAGCLADPAPPPATPQPTVLDDQLKAIDRAKAVEQDLQEGKDRTDAALEDQGG